MRNFNRIKATHSVIIVAVIFMMCSCASFKSELIPNGGKDEAIQNAITDFSSTSSIYRTNDVFVLEVYDPLFRMTLKNIDNRNDKWVKDYPIEGIIAVKVSASNNKMLLTDSVLIGSKGKLASRFFEKDGKLFYWWDDDYPLTKEALDIFKKFDLLTDNDLDGAIEFFDSGVNDAQKAVHFFFCKTDLRNYRKNTSSVAIGYYTPPELDCN